MSSTVASPNGNSESQSPPPLPKRNQRPVDILNNRHPPYANGKVVANANALFLHNEINANLRHVTDKEVKGRRSSPRLAVKLHSKLEDSDLIDNPLYSDHPPPLPPRVPLSAPVIGNEPDAVNSINKQMSYPLVATCATLVNDNVSNMLF